MSRPTIMDTFPVDLWILEMFSCILFLNRSVANGNVINYIFSCNMCVCIYACMHVCMLHAGNMFCQLQVFDVYMSIPTYIKPVELCDYNLKLSTNTHVTPILKA